MALTETEIKTFKPNPSRHRWVSDGEGLYLRIMPSGRRSWVWRRKRAGETKYVTVGEWPDMTVKEARLELAKRTGRATPINALTVADALEDWFEQQITPRYRDPSNMRTYVDRASAEFGKRRLQELTRAEVARFVRGYGKDAPVAANRCLSALKVAFGWCVEFGYLDSSPAAGLTRRVAGGNETTRARVLTDDEIRTVWAWDHPAGRVCRFLLLTGLRLHREAQLAEVAHINGDRLVIPPFHAKNKREHWICLCSAARAQIEPDAAPLLFSAHKADEVQHRVRQLQEGSSNPWRPHDLRRTMATRMGDLGVAPHVIEKCLNHTAQGVAAIYNRAELEAERIAATKLWADELERLCVARTA